MKSIKEIESQNVECKESWRDKYMKWICGFRQRPRRTHLYRCERQEGNCRRKEQQAAHGGHSQQGGHPPRYSCKCQPAP